MRSQIIGSGFVTGENLVTNDQLARIMDTSDAWIRERSGVETRYYVEHGTSTSDLGLGAARKALDDAGVAKEEVDYIVFATMTPLLFSRMRRHPPGQARSRAGARARHPAA